MIETIISKNLKDGTVVVSVELYSAGFGWNWRNGWRLIRSGLYLGLFGYVRVNVTHNRARVSHG